jgi:hypothetical protein
MQMKGLKEKLGIILQVLVRTDLSAESPRETSMPLVPGYGLRTW